MAADYDLGHLKHSSESISESSQAEEAEEADDEQTCWRATDDVMNKSSMTL